MTVCGEQTPQWSCGRVVESDEAEQKTVNWSGMEVWQLLSFARGHAGGIRGREKS